VVEVLVLEVALDFELSPFVELDLVVLVLGGEEEDEDLMSEVLSSAELVFLGFGSEEVLVVFLVEDFFSADVFFFSDFCFVVLIGFVVDFDILVLDGLGRG